MLLFHGIKFSKMKYFIDIIAKIFSNGSILLKRNIVFFRFLQVYEFRVNMKAKIAVNPVIRSNF